MITREEVLHIAKLSKLKLDEEEILHFTGQMDAILEYVDNLALAPVEGIEPAVAVTALTADVVREDNPVPSLAKDVILENGPEVEADHFAIPKVIE